MPAPAPLSLQELLALELALLHTDHAGRPQALQDLLAPDFTEIAGNGRISSRDEVIQWLLGKDASARWELGETRMTALGATLLLLDYHARQVAPKASTGKGARHASLWRFEPALSAWQLCFHQATRVQ